MACLNAMYNLLFLRFRGCDLRVAFLEAIRFRIQHGGFLVCCSPGARAGVAPQPHDGDQRAPAPQRRDGQLGPYVFPHLVPRLCVVFLWPFRAVEAVSAARPLIVSTTLKRSGQGHVEEDFALRRHPRPRPRLHQDVPRPPHAPRRVPRVPVDAPPQEGTPWVGGGGWRG